MILVAFIGKKSLIVKKLMNSLKRFLKKINLLIKTEF
jgi:hypothetical protein